MKTRFKHLAIDEPRWELRSDIRRNTRLLMTTIWCHWQLMMQVSISRDDEAEERQNFGPLSPLSNLLGLLFLFVIRNLSFAFDIGGFIASIPVFAVASSRYEISLWQQNQDTKLILLQIIRSLRHPIHTHSSNSRRSVRYWVRWRLRKQVC